MFLHHCSTYSIFRNRNERMLHGENRKYTQFRRRPIKTSHDYQHRIRKLWQSRLYRWYQNRLRQGSWCHIQKSRHSYVSPFINITQLSNINHKAYVISRRLEKNKPLGIFFKTPLDLKFFLKSSSAKYVGRYFFNMRGKRREVSFSFEINRFTVPRCGMQSIKIHFIFTFNTPTLSSFTFSLFALLFREFIRSTKRTDYLVK